VSPAPPPSVYPVVRLFPLPGVVLFPHSVLPLHVFEPRYREMVHDALTDDGRIAIAHLMPGFDKEYERTPPIHPLGTVGYIHEPEPLPDGKFNLKLVGLRRVEFQEIASDRLYRLAHAIPRPERGVDAADTGIRRAKIDLLASYTYLMRQLTGKNTPLLFDEKIDFNTAVNGVCAALPVEPLLKQSLLAIDHMLDRLRHASELVDRLLAETLHSKPPTDGDGSLPPN